METRKQYKIYIAYTKKWEKIFCIISAQFIPFPFRFICFPSLSKATVSMCSAPHCG